MIFYFYENIILNELISMPKEMIKINCLFNFSFIFFLLVLAGCTAHYPVNKPITSINKNEGYRLLKSQGREDRSDPFPTRRGVDRQPPVAGSVRRTGDPSAREIAEQP